MSATFDYRPQLPRSKNVSSDKTSGRQAVDDRNAGTLGSDLGVSGRIRGWDGAAASKRAGLRLLSKPEIKYLSDSKSRSSC